MFESRISELEAQLTQCRIDLRKAQEEAEMYKRKLEDSQPSSSNYDFYKQIENLQRFDSMDCLKVFYQSTTLKISLRSF